MRGRHRRVDRIPTEQSAIVGANMRVLRLREGWTQGQLGELMGWPTTSTVCAAEGHRDGRQWGFTAKEVGQLAMRGRKDRCVHRQGVQIGTFCAARCSPAVRARTCGGPG